MNIYQRKTEKIFKIVLKGFYPKLNVEYVKFDLQEKEYKKYKNNIINLIKNLLQFRSTIYYNI